MFSQIKQFSNRLSDNSLPIQWHHLYYFFLLVWDMHITRVVNFWENWLFQTGSYNGGMMWVHLQANEKHKLTTELFERWLALWFISTEELFSGKNAEFVKSKALEIGQIMNAKMNQ